MKRLFNYGMSGDNHVFSAIQLSKSFIEHFYDSFVISSKYLYIIQCVFCRLRNCFSTCLSYMVSENSTQPFPPMLKSHLHCNLCISFQTADNILHEGSILILNIHYVVLALKLGWPNICSPQQDWFWFFDWCLWNGILCHLNSQLHPKVRIQNDPNDEATAEVQLSYLEHCPEPLISKPNQSGRRRAILGERGDRQNYWNQR